jgi:hypothetical protein
MARALGLAVTLVLLAAPSASAYTEPSGDLVAGSKETVLRLHDLPPGYQVGDDSGCGSFGPLEGDSTRLTRRYERWVFKYRPEGCIYQYEQIFAVPGLGPAPPLVEAQTVNTPSEAAVAGGFRFYTAILNRFKEGQPREAVSIAPSVPHVFLIRLKNELVEGKIHQPATLLFWRFGKLISYVEAAGMSPRHNDSAALHFARLQQERLEHPSPHAEAERDDSEVWLDDPGLKFPVYWVGNPFQPAGRPPVELEYAYTGYVGPPGEKYTIEYELLEVDGFRLDGWTRHSWKRYQRSALWKVNRPSRCTRTTDVELDEGRAVIYGSYDREPHRPCPGGAPDRYYAIAHIGGMVIGVDLGICLSCLPGAGSGPWASVRGMKAIVRALVVRPKPVY